MTADDDVIRGPSEADGWQVVCAEGNCVLDGDMLAVDERRALSDVPANGANPVLVGTDSGPTHRLMSISVIPHVMGTIQVASSPFPYLCGLVDHSHVARPCSLLRLTKIKTNSLPFINLTGGVRCRIHPTSSRVPMSYI